MNNHLIYNFRLANTGDAPEIWEIISDAIRRRKEEGSTQWQDGYPNPEVIKNDISRKAGYVLCHGETIIGYIVIMANDEPEYARLRGKWLTEGDFIVFHRVAVHADYLGKGLAKYMIKSIENIARELRIYSIKADTNYDNKAMLRIFESLGYTYCGEVTFRGTNVRMAFEKVLS